MIQLINIVGACVTVWYWYSCMTTRKVKAHRSCVSCDGLMSFDLMERRRKPINVTVDGVAVEIPCVYEYMRTAPIKLTGNELCVDSLSIKNIVFDESYGKKLMMRSLMLMVLMVTMSVSDRLEEEALFLLVMFIFRCLPLRIYPVYILFYVYKRGCEWRVAHDTRRVQHYSFVAMAAEVLIPATTAKFVVYFVMCLLVWISLAHFHFISRNPEKGNSTAEFRACTWLIITMVVQNPIFYLDFDVCLFDVSVLQNWALSLLFM